MPITNEQVFQTADELAANGQDPTLAAIRRTLGGGSFTTISEAMKEWRKRRQAAEFTPREPPPESINKRLSELGAELWAAASEAARGRLQAERADLEKVRYDIERQQIEAAEMADQMNSEIEQLRARVLSLDDSAEKLRRELEMAKQKTIAAEARYTEQEKRITDTREELKNAQRKLDESELRERTSAQRAAELEVTCGILKTEIENFQRHI